MSSGRMDYKLVFDLLVEEYRQHLDYRTLGVLACVDKESHATLKHVMQTTRSC